MLNVLVPAAMSMIGGLLGGDSETEYKVMPRSPEMDWWWQNELLPALFGIQTQEAERVPQSESIAPKATDIIPDTYNDYPKEKRGTTPKQTGIKGEKGRFKRNIDDYLRGVEDAARQYGGLLNTLLQFSTGLLTPPKVMNIPMFGAIPMYGLARARTRAYLPVVESMAGLGGERLKSQLLPVQARKEMYIDLPLNIFREQERLRYQAPAVVSPTPLGGLAQMLGKIGLIGMMKSLGWVDSGGGSMASALMG